MGNSRRFVVRTLSSLALLLACVATASVVPPGLADQLPEDSPVWFSEGICASYSRAYEER